MAAKPHSIRLRTSLGLVLFCLYAPFAWLLVVDFPVDTWRTVWLELWPVLPIITPGTILFPGAGMVAGVGRIITAVFAVVLIPILVRAGTFSIPALAGAGFVALVWAIASAVQTYQFCCM